MDVRPSEGQPLLVRPIRARDKPLLKSGMARLSADSTRARFLTAKPRLTSAELAYLTEIDGVNHFALVAVRADRPEELVAVARYVRLMDDRSTAEIAIVVADEYQGHGLGRRLGLTLADHARARGVQRFVGLMLTDNRAAHRLFETISQRMSTQHDRGGVDRVVGELAA